MHFKEVKKQAIWQMFWLGAIATVKEKMNAEVRYTVSLEANGSPKPEFETDANNSFFKATIPIHEAFVDEELFVACNQLATKVSMYVKELIMSLKGQKLSKQEMQLATVWGVRILL